MLYTKSSDLYDIFYADKDYKREVELLFDIVKKHKHENIKSILDVACGTGNHIQFFRNYFQEVEGADLSRDLLKISKSKFPDITFYNQNMLTINTGKKFDVISILFSSIAYLKNNDELEQTFRSFGENLNDDGMILIEPGFTPDTWKNYQINKCEIEQNGKLYIRVSTSLSSGKIAEFDEHYLIASKENVEHVVEHHRFTLFENSEIERALEKEGFSVFFDSKGIIGRGLFIAKKC